MEWAQSISNHCCWVASSSHGDRDLVMAKWLSILRHITNIHTGHGNPFNSCMHGPLEPRQWLKPGSKPHKELALIVTNKLLCKDMRKLAFRPQTSSLESFHKLVTKSVHFATMKLSFALGL